MFLIAFLVPLIFTLFYCPISGVHHNRNWIDNGEINITRENSPGPLRRATGDSSPNTEMIRAFGRGKIIFEEIFSSHYPSFRNEFLEVTGLSIEDFYLMLFVMRVLAEANFHIGIPTLMEAMPHLSASINAFILSETQTPQDLKNALWGNKTDITTPEEAYIYDQKPLRDRPILRLSDERLVVIDLTFLTEKASIGPLFHLLRQQNIDGRRVFSAFGHAFEKYASDILKRMYPSSSPGIFDRLVCSYSGTSSDGNSIEVCDAMLDDVEQSVLFEMKAKWIRDDRLDSENPEEFISYVINQYSNGKPLLQLANSIAKLSSDEYQPDAGRFPSKKIFPVILCYDSLLNAIGYSWTFAEKFRADIQAEKVYTTGVMQKGRFFIAPLILMTIDVLEDLEVSVKNFTLCELLSDYSTKCSNRMDTLHSFIRGTKYRNLMDTRGSVVEKSLELMNEAHKLINPNWEPDSELSDNNEEL